LPGFDGLARHFDRLTGLRRTHGRSRDGAHLTRLFTESLEFAYLGPKPNSKERELKVLGLRLLLHLAQTGNGANISHAIADIGESCSPARISPD
jgi:hypothetical protein